jgi:CheY-like chemotaxis protein
VASTAPPPLRVLVVASDPDVLLTTAAALREGGHEVLAAEDGMAGLRLAASLPNVIVVDEQLSDLTGRDVCRRLKTVPATALIPVLQLCTRATGAEANASGLGATADGCLEHPVEGERLRAAVLALAAHERLSQIEAVTGPIGVAPPDERGGGVG